MFSMLQGVGILPILILFLPLGCIGIVLKLIWAEFGMVFVPNFVALIWTVLVANFVVLLRTGLGHVFGQNLVKLHPSTHEGDTKSVTPN